MKVRRFGDLCELFHLPFVSIVDMPGFEVGTNAERGTQVRIQSSFLSFADRGTVPGGIWKSESGFLSIPRHP